MLNVILPMAGYGRRFREVGYKQEKPLIEVGGRTLLQWSLDSLPAEVSLVPVIRKDQWALADAAAVRGWTPVVLHGPTQGAACTVLAAAVSLPPNEPVLVLNADQWFKIGRTRVAGKGLCGVTEMGGLQGICNFAVSQLWDGFILTFPGTGPAWSYAVTNGTDRVVWVVEKKPVSEHATVGVYWWRRAGDLVRSICAMVASGQRTNNEFYLAPAYNFLPLADRDVKVVPVEEFRGLGTPEQVREFEAALEGGWRP